MMNSHFLNAHSSNTCRRRKAVNRFNVYYVNPPAELDPSRLRWPPSSPRCDAPCRSCRRRLSAPRSFSYLSLTSLTAKEQLSDEKRNQKQEADRRLSKSSGGADGSPKFLQLFPTASTEDYNLDFETKKRNDVLDFLAKGVIIEDALAVRSSKMSYNHVFSRFNLDHGDNCHLGIREKLRNKSRSNIDFCGKFKHPWPSNEIRFSDELRNNFGEVIKRKVDDNCNPREKYPEIERKKTFKKSLSTENTNNIFVSKSRCSMVKAKTRPSSLENVSSISLPFTKLEISHVCVLEPSGAKQANFESASSSNKERARAAEKTSRAVSTSPSTSTQSTQTPFYSEKSVSAASNVSSMSNCGTQTPNSLFPTSSFEEKSKKMKDFQVQVLVPSSLVPKEVAKSGAIEFSNGEKGAIRVAYSCFPMSNSSLWYVSPATEAVSSNSTYVNSISLESAEILQRVHECLTSKAAAKGHVEASVQSSPLTLGQTMEDTTCQTSLESNVNDPHSSLQTFLGPSLDNSCTSTDSSTIREEDKNLCRLIARTESLFPSFPDFKVASHSTSALLQDSSLEVISKSFHLFGRRTSLDETQDMKITSVSKYEPKKLETSCLADPPKRSKSQEKRNKTFETSPPSECESKNTPNLHSGTDEFLREQIATKDLVATERPSRTKLDLESKPKAAEAKQSTLENFDLFSFQESDESFLSNQVGDTFASAVPQQEADKEDERSPSFISSPAATRAKAKILPVPEFASKVYDRFKNEAFKLLPGHNAFKDSRPVFHSPEIGECLKNKVVPTLKVNSRRLPKRKPHKPFLQNDDYLEKVMGLKKDTEDSSSVFPPPGYNSYAELNRGRKWNHGPYLCGH